MQDFSSDVCQLYGRFRIIVVCFLIEGFVASIIVDFLSFKSAQLPSLG